MECFFFIIKELYKIVFYEDFCFFVFNLINKKLNKVVKLYKLEVFYFLEN